MITSAETATVIDPMQCELTEISTHQGHILTLYLKTQSYNQSDIILVGDVLRSITLLQISSETGKLIEIARDYDCNYMRCIEILGNSNEYFFGCDDNGNLFTLKRLFDNNIPTTVTTTIENNNKLELFGEFHLGDCINVIHNGMIGTQVQTQTQSDEQSQFRHEMSEDHTIAPIINSITGMPYHNTTYIFGTVNGSIGTILMLNEEIYQFYNSLENAIKSIIQSIGGLSHNDWRSFDNGRRVGPQKNFIDGDLIETFLDLTIDYQQIIVKQLNDDLISKKHNIKKGSATTIQASVSANANNVTSLETLLTTNEHQYELEEILRKVEDIIRLH